MSKPTTMFQMLRRLCGAGALTAAGTTGLYAGGHYLLTLLPARNVEALTTIAVLVIGLVVLLWYVLSAAIALACLLGRMTGLVWTGGEALVRRSGAPAVRRLLGSGAGAMLVAGSLLGPAYAEEPHEEATSVSLTWSPAPTAESEQDPEEVSGDDGTQGQQAPADRQPTDDRAPEEPDDDAGAASTPGHQAGATHTVQAGDTLWSLAATTLGEDATDAQIAAHWPQWYQVNSEVIGTDPDLIIPGQRLTHPEGSTMTAVTTRPHHVPDAPILPAGQAPDLQIRPDTEREPWDRVRFSGPAHAETDDDGECRPGGVHQAPGIGHDDPPEPTHWAATLVRATVEVLKGQRPAAQLVRWVEADLWAALDRRARLGVHVDGRPQRPTPVRVRRVHGCALSTAVWECSVVVEDGGRMRAVALRLELLRGRWRATALNIG